MATIGERIEKDIVTAMKARDEHVLTTLRMVKSALKNKQIEKREGLTEAEETQVLTTLIDRQRRNDQGKQVQQQQLEGAWLCPEMDMQRASERHRQHSEQNDSPTNCCANPPLLARSRPPRQREDVADPGGLMSDGSQDQEADEEKEQQKDGREQWLCGEDVVAHGEAAGGAVSQRLRREKPGEGCSGEQQMELAGDTG